MLSSSTQKQEENKSKRSESKTDESP